MSSFTCCIPGCSNRHIEWTTPLPRDELLQSRWHDAIRVGTGGLSPMEARICNAHFVDRGGPPAEDGTGAGYQEPTLFYRNNVPLQVIWCRLCLCHDTLGSMFNANGRSSIANQSLSWMANKHFGVWLDPPMPSEVHYFCAKCKERLEATHTFGLEIQQAAQKYRLLREKMSSQNLSLTPSNRSTPYPVEAYPAIDNGSLDDLPQKPYFVEIPADALAPKKQNPGKTFAVVEFVSKTAALKILAVPTSWLNDDRLRWPKLMDGEAIYSLRKEGAVLHDGIDTDSYPVIVLQQFGDYHSAEAAVQVILRRRNPEPSTSTAIPKDILTHSTFRTEIHHLKADLNSIIQTAVAAAAERSFHTNQNSFPMAYDHQNQPPFHSRQAARLASEIILPVQAEAEKHKKISTEPELDDFNTRLADPTVQQKYLDYFSKIVHPKSCSGNGDNALYTVVDYLFTRDFWNNFTWTGINRGQKSSRGFREFANVIHLLLNIVLLGDSAYDSQRLEQFCRTKLFRYSKSRAAGKQLRKSTCRPGRKRPPLDDSRSSDGGGDAEPSMSGSEMANQDVVCKVESFSEEMWQQSSNVAQNQYSDEMM
ncbi:uncharacterized protein LOC115267916 [Aedes albopictus]|uniref:ZAD domain-containing protein n=1 Tax=Aedes albopictus TaxID=7160 RepID=A0ABM1ZPN4_AEDAL|nr:uncharacterized protein LOC109426394 [Aedes albopictus]